ncbi:hypothetical protein [Candidatus Palauibacter sp.]|uniref:hypothetical protein n=1 Tax=Candidatus Palauibacter sp. TaxID=3101350 RepID=UPI003C6FFF77
MIRRLPFPAACAVAILCACARPSPDGTAESSDETGGELLAAPVDARYLTHLLFADGDGNAFFGSFDQTARGPHLSRDYEVQVSDGGPWRSLLLARDTLAVARAGWRLLPAPGMSVRVGDAGQVVSLHFTGPPDRADEGAEAMRLVAGEQVSVWTGPTGQRESLGIGVLQTGPEALPGMLFFRRAARALRIPAPAEGGETLLFADSLGNGFLIHAGALGQPAVAYTWLHGIEATWGEVMLAPPDPASASARRFEIAGSELWGTFRPLATEVPGVASAVRLEAVLRIGGEEFHFTGLSATLPTP